MSSCNNHLLVIAILGGVLIGGCDQRPTEPTQDESITFTQRPIVYPDDSSDEELAKSNQPQGRYYCLVGTLNPECTRWAYRYRAFNVNLPPGLANKAQQSPQNDKWLRIRLGNRNATGRSKADAMPEGGVSVRTVRCNLPPLAEVTAIVRKKLREFSPQSWVGQHPDRASGTGESQPKATGPRQQSEVVCVEYEVIEYCPNAEDNVTGDGIDPGCYMAGIIGCSKYALVEDTEKDPDNGTGGSSDSGGDSGDVCQPSGGDTGFTGVDGGVPLSCKEEDPEPCETNGEHPIFESQIVLDGIKNLWEKQANSNVEEGAFVYKNNFGAYSFNQLTDNMIIDQGFDFIKFGVPENAPNNMTFIHTHPTRETLSKNGITFEYQHRPSDDDYSAMESDKIAKGYILDPDMIIEFNSTGVTDTLDRCGY